MLLCQQDCTSSLDGCVESVWSAFPALQTADGVAQGFRQQGSLEHLNSEVQTLLVYRA